MTLSDLAAVVALGVSAVSLFFSHRSLRSSVRPVLVFSRTRHPYPSWQLENVGSGPALNVTVQEKSWKGDRAVDPINYYPFSVGEKRPLCEIKIGGQFIATYQDADGWWYETVCRDNQSVTHRLWRRPHIASHRNEWDVSETFDHDDLPTTTTQAPSETTTEPAETNC